MKAAHEDKESLTGGRERRSWRELQLPVSIAMRKQGRRGEAEVQCEGMKWKEERRGEGSEREAGDGADPGKWRRRGAPGGRRR